MAIIDGSDKGNYGWGETVGAQFSLNADGAPAHQFDLFLRQQLLELIAA